MLLAVRSFRTLWLFCCYWDDIVRNFLYFFCRQLPDFFFIQFFVGETGIPTENSMASDISRINFHIRSNVGIMAANKGTVNQSESYNCIIRG